MAIRVASTDDISLVDLRDFGNSLASQLPSQVEERQTAYRSFEPPSWIALFNEAPVWIEIRSLVGFTSAVWVRGALAGH
jgi:hypothetical protein